MQSEYIPRMLHYGDEVITEEALLAKHDVIVVLAEPGAGKTELLRSLAERLAAEPCKASLFRHRSLPGPVRALVVDALDEVARIDQAAIDLVIEKARETQAVIRAYERPMKDRRQGLRERANKGRVISPSG